jgi:hypothetical protein
MRVSDWRPYADKWYPHELVCSKCGAVKPAGGIHPTGWTKRYTPATRTQARCPACSIAALRPTPGAGVPATTP